MKDIKKNLRRVFWLFFTLFLITVVYLGHFIIFTSPRIVNTTLNPRVRITRENIVRGEILDNSGNPVAVNRYGGRHYPLGSALAHVIGYVDMGHAGIEERYNFNLINLHNEVYQRLMNLAFETELQGDSLALTINAPLQNLIYSRITRGSAIVLEPGTGRILAMVSAPSFDPNYVARDWERLTTDTENTPLLNRAVFGQYPPGSTFKILTAYAGLSKGYSLFTHNCQGYITVGNNTVRCFNSVAHGHVNKTEAFALSCNTYFVALALEMGEEFGEFMESFFVPRNFSLPHNNGNFSLEGEDFTGELMQSAIGQGRVLLSPLNLALLTGAIANEGVMMEPYLVNNVIDYRGQGRRTFRPRAIDTPFSPYLTGYLKTMMTEVVNQGTGRPAALPHIQIAGKTGTAETDGASHGWFAGFAPADNPQIVVVVMMEHSGGTGPVLPLVRDIVEFYFR